MNSPTPVQIEPMLSARGIVNRFGKQVVHNQIDLDIAPGEILGIAGGSGSGKSVLLKTMIGLRKPDAGLLLALLRLHYFHLFTSG